MNVIDACEQMLTTKLRRKPGVTAFGGATLLLVFRPLWPTFVGAA